MKSEAAFLEGAVLLIDKPLGWTSFQAVNAVKWAIRRKYNLKKVKVGHAGTLDPLASGLLLVCTGRATKKIEDLQGQPKEYTGQFTLGASTPSYDLETEADRHFPTEHITEAAIHAAARHFTGIIQQTPPVFSALKKDGKRMYEYARKGEKVEVPARTIQIFKFEITAIQMPRITFRVRCSKGTYIRSLAQDFGLFLESGAHLSALRRTKIGDYDVNMAVAPEEFRTRLLGENGKQ
jgi:tRNA pseudouridine55 synthase